MKKFALLCAVVCLSVCGMAAQTLPSDTVRFGPNTVEVTARHADGEVFYHHVGHNLKTTLGVDVLGQCTLYSCSALPIAVLNLSTNSATPAAGDCVSPGNAAACPFTGLLNTGGLAPALATYGHSTGSGAFTLTYTWTATGATSNVQKAAISHTNLNTCTNYDCGYFFENTFTPVSLSTNDQLQITWTITIS